MKKILSFNFAIILSLNLFSQTGNNQLIAEYEDTLKIIAHEIMNARLEKDRRIANEAFINHLHEALQYEKSFKFPFDSLNTISKISSPDKTFRIFTWLLRKSNGTYEYYGIIHLYIKKYKRYEIISLIDNSSNIRNPEEQSLDARNWYGGIIYDIIYIKEKGKRYYTLLLWDGNDRYSTKKIIDVMYFEGNNEVKFGWPIFKQINGEIQNRVILEYDSKTSITMKYNENGNEIIFNHLVPSKKDLEGLYEYYIPDGTFNSFKYQKGKWLLTEDVDIRNNEKIINHKKPDIGLMPN